MSFYRMFIAAVAALTLTTAVFANDENANSAGQQQDATQAVQVADSGAAASDENQAQTKVDLNKATAKELAKVKGLSMTKARSIISYRKKHGDFKSLDDLKMVKGFKKMDEKTMKDIQDQLTVG
jgi:competence protein ComEA